MTFDLQVVVATRGRPANVERLIASFLATSDNAHLLLVQDIDDPLADWRIQHSRVTPIPYDRKGEAGCSRQLNYGARFSAVGYKYIGSCNDDHVFRTPGWDRKMMAALGDRVGVCCANDLLKNGKFPTAMIMSAVIVRALGRMHPEEYRHGSPDNAWKLIARGLGCYIYLPEVIIEHMHPIAHKAQPDAVYIEAHKQDDRDLIVGKEWERTGLAKDIQTVRERVALEQNERQPVQAQWDGAGTA